MGRTQTTGAHKGGKATLGVKAEVRRKEKISEICENICEICGKPHHFITPSQRHSIT